MKENLKEAVKEFELGTDLKEIIRKLNRKLVGWANYFKAGNSYKHANELSSYACMQLRIYWRRVKKQKRIQGTKKWKNKYFYEKGLYYVPNLL